MEIQGLCPHCHKDLLISYEPGKQAICSHCQKDPLPHPTEGFLKDLTLNQCPLCGCPHLYRQRDFNRKLGVSLLVIGVLLAFFTYGISLLVVTLIDFFLYRYVGEVGICYACRSTYRGKGIESLEPFSLSLHDYYRNLENNPKKVTDPE